MLRKTFTVSARVSEFVFVDNSVVLHFAAIHLMRKKLVDPFENSIYLVTFLMVILLLWNTIVLEFFQIFISDERVRTLRLRIIVIIFSAFLKAFVSFINSYVW